MDIKKTCVAAVITVGMTVTAAGSYASTSTDSTSASEAAASVQADRAAVKEQRALTAASADVTATDAAKRKCVSKKKIRHLRVFMKYKKVMKRLPRATYKNQSGGLKFRSFNACTSSLSTDLDLVFKKLHRKWTVYDVSVYWS